MFYNINFTENQQLILITNNNYMNAYLLGFFNVSLISIDLIPIYSSQRSNFYRTLY